MSYAFRSEGWVEKDVKIECIGWMNRDVKNEFIAAIGEYIGTVLFLFFAFAGTQIANVPTAAAVGYQPAAANILYIAVSFGFSLAVNAWVFYRISGSLFNPAVTFAMVLAEAITWKRGISLFISQMLGGITAAALILIILPGPLSVATKLGGGCTITRGLFLEMFLTAELVFTIFMLANEKNKATFLAPIGIGLALFVGELAGVYYTGGSLNPARTFGPAVVLHSFDGYHWIYWIGPFLGSILATAFYKVIKILEYETANPSQDADLDGARIAKELEEARSSTWEGHHEIP